MRIQFRAIGADGDDRTGELEEFANLIGLEQVASGRYSIALVAGLFGDHKSRFQNPFKVIDEIKILEGIGGPSDTKEAKIFRHPPLKGLWHKHYLDDRLSSMAINLKKGIERHGIPILHRLIEESEQSDTQRYLTSADFGAISYDAIVGNWTRLHESKELTGEWIVYAKYQQQNYYLCLENHDRRGHDQLRTQIEAICCREFPFVSELLAA